MKRTNGGRPSVRFRRVELDFGRHSSAYDLGEGDRPFVIEGPNGCGKSSLIEGLVRTLYGFRRGRREERAAYELRRPWSERVYRGQVTLATTRGEWTVERDFETDRVTIRPHEEPPAFEGDANPAGAGESARRYRKLLVGAIGIADLDHYLRTACVFQGGLRGTSLSLDLLRVAAGGHTDVDTAQRRLADEYRDLTLEPIAEGVARRRKPGVVERLARDATELERRLRAARVADEKRGPLVQARREARTAMAALERELEKLETAFEKLSEARRLEEAAAASGARVRRLERVARDLDEALARLDLARERSARGPAPSYPDDFLERVRALEEGLWPRVAALEAELAHLRLPVEPGGGDHLRLIAPAGMVLLLLAVLVATLGSAPAPAVAVATAGLACLVMWAARRRAEVGRARERAERRPAVERELDEVRGRVGRLLDGVPDSSTLSPGSLPGRRAEFAREAAERALVSDSEQALRAAMDLAARELAEAGDRETEGRDRATTPEPRSGGGFDGSPGGLAQRARALLRALHVAISDERDETLAPLKVRLGDIGRARFDLPSGVDPTAEGVRAARRRCLERTESVRGELAAIERQLGGEHRPEASARSLEFELEAVRAELAEREARARAYRSAFSLVGEAYEAFRRTDEERLLEAVSRHLEALSGGTLGPLKAGSGLDDARVLLGDRAVPIDSPPLSYGQLHTALLSIRIGAADFLAGLGVRLPLLIDDPFVHLDERSAQDLWNVLARIASERQVIVATQDRLLLGHLGVEPDLRLREAVAAPTPREVREGASANGREARETTAGEETPDLWSQLER